MTRNLILLITAIVAMLPSICRAENSAAKPTVTDDILVGVNYFAGWWRELPNKWHGQGWKVGQPDWRPHYPERVPTLGEYNEQSTMDKEIIAASSHGIDFFAILWYYQKPETPQSEKAPLLNRGLEQFIASREASRMKFCIEYCNAPHFSAETEEQWAECLKVWVEAMKHPSYLRVDGRLVFRVHEVSTFLKANQMNLDLCRQRLDAFRAAVRAAGLGEMIIGVGLSGHTKKVGMKWPPASLFDFTGNYMCVPEDNPGEDDQPYATLAAQARRTMQERIGEPLPWTPYLAAGWNPRPWTYRDAPSHYQCFFDFPTREQFTAELRWMKESLEKHPTLGLPKKDGTTQKAFTIYAWNEFGEGGIIAPTKTRGAIMLEAIKEVFGK